MCLEIFRREIDWLKGNGPMVNSTMIDYQLHADEEVVALYHAGDDHALEYLLQKYKNFVRAKVRPYYIIGATKEDLLQEGTIGLYKAIRDFDVEKNASFITFAEMCIVRQVITAVKSATRMKHQPLNFYISLDKPVTDEDNERTSLIDTIYKRHDASPEEIMLNRESQLALEKQAYEKLSPLERQVLFLYAEGRSYQEISQIMGKPTKTIDNALQRIKKKTR